MWGNDATSLQGKYRWNTCKDQELRTVYFGYKGIHVECEYTYIVNRYIICMLYIDMYITATTVKLVQPLISCLYSDLCSILGHT